MMTQSTAPESDGNRGTHAGGRVRPFGVICVIWLLLSFVAPSLPYSDAAILILAWSGAIWVVGILWFAIPIAASVIATRRALAGRYWSAVPWSAVPASIILLYFGGTHLADTIRFRLEKPSLDRVVADVEAGRCSNADRRRWGVAVDAYSCRTPFVVVFPWGGFLSSWHGVVYDAADEIARAPTERSRRWKDSEIGNELSCSGARFSFGHHYYRAGGNFVPAKETCR